MLKQLRFVCILVVLILLVGYQTLTLAQEETETPSPPTETATEIPPTATEIPPTEIPTEVAPTETAIPPTETEIPTETASEIPTEETAVPTNDEVTATPTLTETVDVLPPEPALVVQHGDNFESSDFSAYTFGAGWALTPHDNGQAVQVFNNNDPMTLAIYPTLYNAAVQAAFNVTYGTAQLGLRQAGYVLTLDNAGTALLYRAGVVIGTATVQPTVDGWHTLRLSAINDLVRASVDGVEVIALRDPAPLGAGAVTWGGVFVVSSDARLPENTVQIDDLLVFVPAESYQTPPSVSPTVEPATPTVIPSPEPLGMSAQVAPLISAQAVCDPNAAVSRITYGMGDTLPNQRSTQPDISADGRYVVFVSEASNLVPNDTNSYTDVFLYDRQTCITSLLSVNAAGTGPGNLGSANPTISPDGRYVAFYSAANNLVPNLTVSIGFIYVRDLQTNTTQLISKGPGGVQPNGQSRYPKISSDGQFVVFQSEASNLTGSTDPSNGYNIYLWSQATNQIIRVSKPLSGTSANGISQAAGISADGQYISFVSYASNLVANDTNSYPDIFLYNRLSGEIKRISLSITGQQVNYGSYEQNISENGNLIVFSSSATNVDNASLGGVFVYDQVSGQVSRVSFGPDGAPLGNGNSFSPAISSDGRYVTYVTRLAMVYGDTNNEDDLYRYDRQTGKTTRVSVSALGFQANGPSVTSALSADGNTVAYWASARNLVGNETDSYDDIYVANVASIAPTSPVILSALPSGTQIQVIWGDTSWNETEFRIQRSIDQTNWTQIGTSPADTTTFTNSGLTCNTLYYYRMRAYRSADNVYSPHSSIFSIRSAQCGSTQTGPQFNVNITTDDNDGFCTTDNCSVREAVIAANSYVGNGVTVNIPAGTYILTRSGEYDDVALTGDLDITRNMTIKGAGATTTVIDGNDLDRIFYIPANKTVSISDLTIQNGYVSGSNISRTEGGGLLIDDHSTVTLTRVHIRDNAAAGGGGISFYGSTLNIIESSIFNNDGLGSGGAILIGGYATLNVTRSTIVNNVARYGTFVRTKTNDVINLTDSTIIGDIYQGAALQVNNTNSILGNAENLGVLQANGGPTWTMAPLPNSPVIGSGTNCGTNDQRGQPRDDGGCDVGAYEANYPPAVMSVTGFDSSNAPAALTENVRTILTLTRIEIRFTEAMANPAGDNGANDVTNPTNYKLVNAGSDGVLQTSVCGALQGDDQFISVSGASWDATKNTVSLVLGLQPLDGNYRLLACETLQDGKSNGLDGNRDGAGGDPLVRNFTVQIAQTGTEFTVNLTNDSGDGVCGVVHCSLREAVGAANASVTPAIINIPAGLYTLSLSGAEDANASGDLDILKPVQIIGAGANVTLIDGGGIDRVFHIKEVAGSVTLANLTVQNGQVGFGLMGGGIFYEGNQTAQFNLTNVAVVNNTSAGVGGGIAIYGANTTATITNNTISGNRTTGQGDPQYYGSGAGIYNNGTLRITNSTISGNQASGWAGGLLTYNLTELNNVTVTGNLANSDNVGNDGRGGGIARENPNAPFRLWNTLIYGNSGSSPDCSSGTGSLQSGDYNLIGNLTSCTLTGDTAHNLIGVNPLLGALANNGGPTQTLMLLPGSPAINAGNNATCAVNDQRGVPRPQNGTCDIGAVEVSGTAYNLVPPIVSRVEKVFSTGSNVIGVALTFSETIQNPPGNSNGSDVTNPANYRIINSGSDGVFQTTTCAALSGDDGQLTINSAVYDPVLFKVQVNANNGTAFPTAFYRLIVCSSLRDTDNNLLDGNRDGVGGDDFVAEVQADAPQIAPAFTVNTTIDGQDGMCGVLHCSLREAVLAANGLTGQTATISLPAGTYTLTLAGQYEDAGKTGDLDIQQSTQIIGSDAATTIIDAAHIDRAIHTMYSSVVLIQGVTIQNGQAPGIQNGGAILALGYSFELREVVVRQNTSASLGGAVSSEYTTQLKIVNSRLENNSAYSGGAVYSSYLLTLTNSTFQNNTANATNGYGGAVLKENNLEVNISGSLFTGNSAAYGGALHINTSSSYGINILNSTFSGNSAAKWGGAFGGMSPNSALMVRFTNVTVTANTSVEAGGGLRNGGGANITVKNSLISGNFSNGQPNDIQATIVSEGYNLFGTLNGLTITGDTATNIVNPSPGLGPLANNGGPTWTHDLLATSSALDAIDPLNCPEYDQRGVYRPMGAACDIGAVEHSSIPYNQIPPTVSHVLYGANLELTEGLAGKLYLSSFNFQFTKAMYNPTGNADPNDVTNPANYRLFSAGTDGIWQTTDCTALGGDDSSMPFAYAFYDALNRSVWINFSTNDVLPIGIYRVMACPTLRDLDGNALDGDGNHAAGGAFVRNFRITGDVPTVTRVTEQNNVPLPDNPPLYEPPITGFKIYFSESMLDTAGNDGVHDVTNPANYRVVAAGADGTLQTTMCGVPQGDDQVIAVNSVTYSQSGNNFVASLNINGGQALPYSYYRLMACENLQSSLGVGLDGNNDGIGGGVYTRLIQADPQQNGPDIYVTSTNSTNDGLCNHRHCSLPEAVQRAQALPNSFVRVPTGFYGAFNQSLVLQGTFTVVGDRDNTVIQSRVTVNTGATISLANLVLNSVNNPPLTIQTGATVTLTDVTVQDSRQSAGIVNQGTLTVIHSLIANNGGGINSSGSLTVIDSTIRDNLGSGISQSGGGHFLVTGTTVTGNGDLGSSGSGGGIFYSGWYPAESAKIINTTISGNKGDEGGGLYVSAVQFPLILENVTIVNNIGTLGGGIYIQPIYVEGPTYLPAHIANSIIWGNIESDQVTRNDYYGELHSLGNNIIGVLKDTTITGDTASNQIGVDPKLESLRDNGGQTLTHALLPGSPAIDAGNSDYCPDTDQRHFPRPTGNGCDIGAFEYEAEGLGAPMVKLVNSWNGEVVNDGVYYGNVGYLEIYFTKPMFNPPGDNGANDVTNYHNYLVIENGVDDVFQTATCGNPLGDDRLASNVPELTYSSGINRLVLPLNNRTAIPVGAYRLIVCDTLRGLDGAVLDGDEDGQPGGDYLVNFRVNEVRSTDTLIVNSSADGNDGLCSTQNCTLREAIIASNQMSGAQTIILSAGSTYTLSLPGRNEDNAQTGDLDIRDNVRIYGSNRATTVIDGNQLDRIFHISGSINVTIQDLTIQNGDATSPGASYSMNGGGVLSEKAARLTLTNVEIRNNNGLEGGGLMVRVDQPTLGFVLNANQLLLTNNHAHDCAGMGNTYTLSTNTSININESTISGNTAEHYGGGLCLGIPTTITNSLISDNHAATASGGINDTTFNLTVINTTFHGNTAGGYGGAVSAGVNPKFINVTFSQNVADFDNDGYGDGGAIYAEGDQFTLANTILYGNEDRSGEAPNCIGEIISLGHNLLGNLTGCTVTGDTQTNMVNVNPLLDPLADNGGVTQTQKLRSNSPAINHAGSAYCPATDQRGYLRPSGAACDIGAFEVQQLPAPPTVVDPPNGALVNLSSLMLTWNYVSGAGSYRIQIDTSASFSSPDVDTVVGEYAYFAQNLSEGVHYWRVQPLNIQNLPAAWSATWSLRVDTLPPAVPPLSQPADGGVIYAARPRLSWRAVTGANRYNLQIALDPNFINVAYEGETNSTTFTMPEALPQNIYYWRVQSRDAAGNWSVNSAARRFVLSLLRLPASESFVIDQTPIFQWYAYTGATRYQLQVASDAAFNNVVLDYITLNARTLSYTAPSLMAFKAYYWRVNIDTGSGFTPSAIIWRTTITPPIPRAPVPVVTTLANTRTPMLSWAASVSTAGTPYSYEVQIDTDSAFRTPDQTLTTNSLWLLPAVLTEGRNYWRVRTINFVGAASSWSTSRSVVVDVTAPAAPALNAPSDNGVIYAARPTFTWRTATSANRYRIQVATNLQFTNPLLDMETASLSQLSSVTLPQGSYFWHVQSRDAAGNWGLWSGARVFTVALQRAPARDGFSVDTTPTFQWYSYPGATRYQLQVATDDAFNNIVVNYTTPNARGLVYTSPTALPLAVYYWRVNVDLGTGFTISPVQWKLVVTPTPAAAPIVTAPANNALLTDATPTLTWNGPAGGPYTYQVQIDTDSYFRTPDQTLTPTGTSVDAGALTDGRYYWRVRAVNSLGVPGAWSSTRSFRLDVP